MDNLEELEAKWKKRYDEGVGSRLQAIETALFKVKGGDFSFLKDLKVEVHKMAGSAGTAGYGRVSEICKAWDKELNQHPAPSLEELQHWDAFFLQIRREFST